MKSISGTILGKFLSSKDPNYKYIALNTLREVAKNDLVSVQKHKNIILECLRDSDISIKTRALDLIYLIVNSSNIKQIIKECNNHEIISEFISNKLLSYASTTREKTNYQGRITDLITSKKIFNDLNISEISSNDRFMFCGSMGLNNDLKKILLDFGLCEGANNNPAEFVLEKAFVG